MVRIDKWGKNVKSYPTANEYFTNKVIFLTGGSGFVGRVFIEKVLRSLPNLKKIYVLLRPKSGFTVDQRMDELFSVELFKSLNEKYGDSWKKKLIPLAGDATKINLGLSKQDQERIINEVDLLYHNAASVRFNDSLKKAIIINTRGTREACKLALRIKNLKAFLHVSTAFSNCHHDVIHEEIYPPIANWEEMIYLAETMNEYELQIISEQLIKPLPNTYTFAKHLAEQVVSDTLKGKLPTIIVRPSIVLPTYSDPFVGWVDNLNGGGGLTLAIGKGILRTQWMTNDQIKLDGIPVDYLVKAMIFIPTYTSTRREANSVEVYNISADKKDLLSIKCATDIARSLIDDVPLASPIWYPCVYYTSNYTLFFIQVIFLHIIPALFVDLVLKLTGHEPLLLNTQKKLFVVLTTLQYFVNKQCTFVNEKIYKARLEMRDEDRANLDVDLEIDQEKFAWEGGLAAKKYLLGEDLDNLERDKRNLFRMKILHYTVKYVLWALFVYYVFYVNWQFWIDMFSTKSYFGRLSDGSYIKF